MSPVREICYAVNVHAHGNNSIHYSLFLHITGTDGQTVTIVSTPAGTPVSGSTNTFDYPILSSVTLTCMVDPPPSGTSTVAYSWDISGCYLTNNGQRNCFLEDQTTQNVTGNNLLADDAGTITCTVTIDGASTTSSQFTLRISGIIINYYIVVYDPLQE